jgi:hypothetical protein
MDPESGRAGSGPQINASEPSLASLSERVIIFFNDQIMSSYRAFQSPQTFKPVHHLSCFFLNKKILKGGSINRVFRVPVRVVFFFFANRWYRVGCPNFERFFSILI